MSGKAASAAVSTASKPEMRGMLNAVIKRNLIVALVLAGMTGCAFKFIICEPKKQRYAEFYRTYDAEKEFQLMKSKGVFQSC